KTKSITIYGKVHGNVTVTERCELKSKCVLQGDLKATRLVIEEGATFIGKSEVTTGAVSAKSAPRPEVVRSSEPIKAAFGARAYKKGFGKYTWPIHRLQKSVRNVRTAASSRWNTQRPRVRCAASAAALLRRSHRNRS